ncbi:MAG TPA: hypothetical protein VFQ53_33430 [Kofleriaceae bacterium]|nr:hypothetical protein [Kofleriaceae bacterium]
MGTKPGNQFRMTLWFKKGEFADDGAVEDDAPSAKLLPIEDRYLDDGSITGDDSRMFSLHSGRTQHVAISGLIRSHDELADERSDDHADVGSLVREMKTGRRKVFAMLGATVAALGTVLVMYVL